MMRRLVADVCVIGGGPAGSATAQRLVEMGHRVVLAEAQRFPRARIGATLPASIMPLIELLGVRDVIESAGFIPAGAPLVTWPHRRPLSPKAHAPMGMLVERARFDAILLDQARRQGVCVLQPGLASKPHRRHESEEWLCRVQIDGSATEVASRVIVDASGRQVIGGPRRRGSPPTVAIYANWRHPPGTRNVSRVAARADHWCWYSDITDTTGVAAVFLDAKYLSRMDRAAIRSLYLKLIGADDLVGQRPLDACGDIKVCDAATHVAVAHAGPGFVKVGDSSLTLDPLSSQGVQAALASGVQAAVIVNTMLVAPSSRDTAIAFYQKRQDERFTQHQQRAARLYAEVAPHFRTAFWTMRAAGGATEGLPDAGDAQLPELSLEQPVRLAPGVRIADTPAIDGNLVVMRRAVSGGRLGGPVAFVRGVELAALLSGVERDQTARTIVHHWSRRYPRSVCREIMQWLWAHGLVVAAHETHR